MLPLTLLTRLQPVFLGAVPAHPRGTRAGVFCFTTFVTVAAVTATCTTLAAVEDDARQRRSKPGPRTAPVTHPTARPPRACTAPAAEGDVNQAAGVRDDVADQARGVFPPRSNVPKAEVAVDHALPDVRLDWGFGGTAIPRVVVAERSGGRPTVGSTQWGTGAKTRGSRTTYTREVSGGAVKKERMCGTRDCLRLSPPSATAGATDSARLCLLFTYLRAKGILLPRQMCPSR